MVGDIEFGGNIDLMGDVFHEVDLIKNMICAVETHDSKTQAMLFDIAHYCAKLQERFVLGSSEKE